jgi:hypothetical protein
MIGIQAHFGPSDELGISVLVEQMRGLEPVVTVPGGHAEEIGMGTFEQRLTDEWKSLSGSDSSHAAERVGVHREQRLWIGREEACTFPVSEWNLKQ